MNNNNSKPSVATLIRDGYLHEDDVPTEKKIALAQLQWSDDYRQFQLDTLDD
jgi:hypothetical protein